MGAFSEKLRRWLNGEPRYAAGHPIGDDTFRRELQLGTLLNRVAVLGDDAAGAGSDLVAVRDPGEVFAGATLTEVLAELYVAASTSTSDTFVDTAGWYPTDAVGAAFAAIAEALGGATAVARNYSSNSVVTDNDSIVVAVGKLDAGIDALAAVIAALTPADVGALPAVGEFVGGGTFDLLYIDGDGLLTVGPADIPLGDILADVLSEAAADATSKADTARNAAISAAATDATTKATTAQNAATTAAALALTNHLPWAASGHTSTALDLPAFNGSGAAAAVSAPVSGARQGKVLGWTSNTQVGWVAVALAMTSDLAGSSVDVDTYGNSAAGVVVYNTKPTSDSGTDV